MLPPAALVTSFISVCIFCSTTAYAIPGSFTHATQKRNQRIESELQVMSSATVEARTYITTELNSIKTVQNLFPQTKVDDDNDNTIRKGWAEAFQNKLTVKVMPLYAFQKISMLRNHEGCSRNCIPIKKARARV